MAIADSPVWAPTDFIVRRSSPHNYPENQPRQKYNFEDPHYRLRGQFLFGTHSPSAQPQIGGELLVHSIYVGCPTELRVQDDTQVFHLRCLF